MNSFKQYMKDQEESEAAIEAEATLGKIKDFIKNFEDISTDALQQFATELDMDPKEVEEIVFTMLKDFLGAEDGDVEGTEDEINLDDAETDVDADEADDATGDDLSDM